MALKLTLNQETGAYSFSGMPTAADAAKYKFTTDSASGEAQPGGSGGGLIDRKTGEYLAFDPGYLKSEAGQQAFGEFQSQLAAAGKDKYGIAVNDLTPTASAAYSKLTDAQKQSLTRTSANGSPLADAAGLNTALDPAMRSQTSGPNTGSIDGTFNGAMNFLTKQYDWAQQQHQQALDRYSEGGGALERGLSKFGEVSPYLMLAGLGGAVFAGAGGLGAAGGGLEGSVAAGTDALTMGQSLGQTSLWGGGAGAPSFAELGGALGGDAAGGTLAGGLPESYWSMVAGDVPAGSLPAAVEGGAATTVAGAAPAAAPATGGIPSWLTNMLTPSPTSLIGPAIQAFSGGGGGGGSSTGGTMGVDLSGFQDSDPYGLNTSNPGWDAATGNFGGDTSTLDGMTNGSNMTALQAYLGQNYPTLGPTEAAAIAQGLSTGNMSGLPSNLSQIAQQIKSLFGGSGSGGSGGLFGSGIGGNIGQMIGSTVPGMMALNYANNTTPIDTSQLTSVYNQAQANAPGLIQSAIDPLRQTQAAGYGDLLQSQANRGIRGSSFGDTDISNYLNSTNRGIANAGATATNAALGLQGNLAGQIANLNAQSQLQKNNLFGRAFDTLGRGLMPAAYTGSNAGTTR